MSETCQKCGVKCCTYFCFEIDTPDDYEQYEDVRWYLCHEGVTVHIEEGDWYIAIENRCKMLGPDNRCTSYETRPLICRRYSMDKCDMTSGDYGYQQFFRAPEELDAYARRTLGAAVYEEAKAKALAKLERKAEKKNKKKKRI